MLITETYKNRYVLSCLSGLLLALSFPTPNLFLLAWIALVPFIYSILDSENRFTTFKLGLIFGIVFFFSTQYWIYHSITHYGNIPFILSISIVLLLCIYQGFYIGLFGVLLNFSCKRLSLPVSISAPVLWITFEYLRGVLFTGFPWSLLGYTQFQFLPLIQIADITGIYGISFLIVFSNGIISEFLLYKKYQGADIYNYTATGGGKLLSLLIFLIIIVLSITYGFARIKSIKGNDVIVVSIIQGNIDQSKKWDPEYQDEVLKIYKNLTIKALKDMPKLVVWPETSVPFFFGSDRKNTEALIDFQRSLNTYLVFGSVLIKEFKKNKYSLSNSVILLSHNGKTIFNYDKIHLVPFGEYVPLKKILFFIDKLVVGIGDFVRGEEYSIAETQIGKFATPICYEIIFPGLIRRFYLNNGGDLLITITNDAWFGRTTGPYQHFVMSIFRAIENRKPLIRAANTGISGFIDSTGKVLKSTRLFERTFITETVIKNTEMTFYTRFGDIFAYLCNIYSLYILLNYIGISRFYKKIHLTTEHTEKSKSKK